MKSYVGLIVAMVVGAAFGAVGVGGLHAQTKPGAYAIIDIGEIADPETFKTLLPSAPEGLTAFGGHIIIRNESFTPLDGIPPNRLVVIRFESVEKAQAWDASAKQQEIDAIRMKSTKSRAFIVEGM